MPQDDRKPFRQWVVDLLFESQQGICTRCGSSLESESFAIHHKDGDHSNNKPDNGELLCVRCHHKTLGTDAFETHRSQELKVLDTLNQVINQASDPLSKMSGATLEKLIEGLSLSLKVSRNATGVDYGLFRMPMSIKLERRVIEAEVSGDSYLNGFMDGVSKTLASMQSKGDKNE